MPSICWKYMQVGGRGSNLKVLLLVPDILLFYWGIRRSRKDSNYRQTDFSSGEEKTILDSCLKMKKNRLMRIWTGRIHPCFKSIIWIKHGSGDPTLGGWLSNDLSFTSCQGSLTVSQLTLAKRFLHVGQGSCVSRPSYLFELVPLRWLHDT